MAANTVAQSSAGIKALLRPILKAVVRCLHQSAHAGLLAEAEECIMDEHDDDLASEVVEGEEIETDAFNVTDEPDTDDLEKPVGDEDTEETDDAEL